MHDPKLSPWTHALVLHDPPTLWHPTALKPAAIRHIEHNRDESLLQLYHQQLGPSHTCLIDLHQAAIGQLLQQAQQRGLVVAQPGALVARTNVINTDGLPRQCGQQQALPEVLAPPEPQHAAAGAGGGKGAGHGLQVLLLVSGGACVGDPRSCCPLRRACVVLLLLLLLVVRLQGLLLLLFQRVKVCYRGPAGMYVVFVGCM